jgi:hypothetical protein
MVLSLRIGTGIGAWLRLRISAGVAKVIGRLTLNDVPLSSSLWRVKVPPIASTYCLVMAMPKPVPL